ncbi:hypothetical protein MBCUT_06760 [Methanobrevibacter cuticularis]|uniref:Uncharacterized protein n=1 Tax=Methanobrevibacter cuticularis TaxID=47311 RepID=A0A166EGS2_9EURY|nr:hypothetical protein [Methanobrevibacter cuticularis]KZX16638.1 hypothetical protein MBCUT_06760 [Methanobrevibacter cuticularis]
MVPLGKRLDGGYGVIGNPSTIFFLESLSLEERKQYIKELEEKNPKAFKEFCESYQEKLKKLGLGEFI